MTATTPRPAWRRRRRRPRRLRVRRPSRRGRRWSAFLRSDRLPKSAFVHRPGGAPTSEESARRAQTSAARLAAGRVPAILVSRTTWDVASKFDRALAPVAVALDVGRLGLAARRDRGVGRHVARAGASIAGSWAGGYAGGVAGSQTGALLGAVGGPVGVVVGGLAGGLVGAVAGAVGLSKASERTVELATRAHDARQARARGRRPRRPAALPRLHNRLRRAAFHGACHQSVTAGPTAANDETDLKHANASSEAVQTSSLHTDIKPNGVFAPETALYKRKSNCALS